MVVSMLPLPDCKWLMPPPGDEATTRGGKRQQPAHRKEGGALSGAATAASLATAGKGGQEEEEDDEWLSWLEDGAQGEEVIWPWGAVPPATITQGEGAWSGSDLSFGSSIDAPNTNRDSAR